MSGSFATQQPYISNLNHTILKLNEPVSITVTGDNFTLGMQAKVISDSGIEFYADIEVHSPTECVISFTPSGNVGRYSLVLTSGGYADSRLWQSQDNGLNVFHVGTSAWMDLREGGHDFAGVFEMCPSTTYSRGADGLTFAGAKPSVSFIRTNNAEYTWDRNTKSTFSAVMKFTNAYSYFGVGSSISSDVSTSQYKEGEALAYQRSGTQVYGLYNYGGKYQSTNKLKIDYTKWYRVDIYENGTRIDLWEVPIDSWDSTNKYIGSINTKPIVPVDPNALLSFMWVPQPGSKLMAIRRV